ncbi:MAG: acetylglutamate kinase [Methanocellales archaeon]|nr:acetylglutamate kinase [Methanocellales archaeon]
MLKRENVLIEALPYIRELHDSITVIKIGGHAMLDQTVMEDIVRDLVLLRYVGVRPIVVHGGGPEITRNTEKMGKKPEFIAGLRITDEETLEIAQMVLVGKVNTRIVSLIGKHGAKGIGLSGKDGRLIVARKKSPQKVLIDGNEKEVDLGWVGETESINPEILMLAVEKGYIPVISPIAVDVYGNSLNINADSIAGDIASSIKSKKLIMLTDVPGILHDPSDPKSLISQISLDDAKKLISSKTVQEGMIPKIEACVKAIEGSVEKAHILGGNLPHALLLELFTDKGIGTMIYR